MFPILYKPTYIKFPFEGLRLDLYAETEEYSARDGYGMRLVIHEADSLPFPSDEGITISTGFETVIGLRLV